MDTTHKRIGLLWCLSSKAALSNSLSDTLGTEHLCHFRRQCHIRLLIIEPCTSTVAGSYSRCIMVIIFGLSVWVCQRGSMKHPRWNCATPSTDVLLHVDRIEPSFAACAAMDPVGFEPTSKTNTRLQFSYAIASI